MIGAKSCPVCGKGPSRCWYGVPPLGFLGLLLVPVWLWVLVGPWMAAGFVTGFLLWSTGVLVMVRKYFDGG